MQRPYGHGHRFRKENLISLLTPAQSTPCTLGAAFLGQEGWVEEGSWELKESLAVVVVLPGTVGDTVTCSCSSAVESCTEDQAAQDEAAAPPPP